jgi:outer membrane scaffolding protein for murein synthesis (MipA/OmpV family)
MTEAQFSKKIIDYINKNSTHFAYKASDRFRSGVPDIYISGGIWVESKKVRKKLYYDPRPIVSPAQKFFCDRLTLAGDTVWIAVFQENIHFYISKWAVYEDSEEERSYRQYFKRDSTTDLASLIDRTILY